jgi:hypothetical protein
MELNFNCLPSDVIHMSGFDGEDAGIRSWMWCLKLILWLTYLGVIAGYADGAHLMWW